MKTVSIMEGDLVTLHTNLTEIQKDDLIKWEFGVQKSLIAEINAEARIFNTSVVPDGRFKDRLKLDHQTGSLTITNTTTEDSGLYLITISNKIEKEYRYNVTVYVQTHKEEVIYVADPTHCMQNSHKRRFKEKDEAVYSGVTMSC
ncbi:hypothetical protein PO909_028378 [Leuciscus waleckii]